jgi:hypothetical protein
VHRRSISIAVDLLAGRGFVLRRLVFVRLCVLLRDLVPVEPVGETGIDRALIGAALRENREPFESFRRVADVVEKPRVVLEIPVVKRVTVTVLAFAD